MIQGEGDLDVDDVVVDPVLSEACILSTVDQDIKKAYSLCYL